MQYCVYDKSVEHLADLELVHDGAVPEAVEHVTGAWTVYRDDDNLGTRVLVWTAERS